MAKLPTKMLPTTTGDISRSKYKIKIVKGQIYNVD